MGNTRGLSNVLPSLPDALPSHHASRGRNITCKKTRYPVTARGIFEGKTRSDGTNPMWRACWASRNLERDAHDLTYGKAHCGSSRFRVKLVGIHVYSRGRHSG